MIDLRSMLTLGSLVLFRAGDCSIIGRVLAISERQPCFALIEINGQQAIVNLAVLTCSQVEQQSAGEKSKPLKAPASPSLWLQEQMNKPVEVACVGVKKKWPGAIREVCEHMTLGSLFRFERAGKGTPDIYWRNVFFVLVKPEVSSAQKPTKSFTSVDGGDSVLDSNEDADPDAPTDFPPGTSRQSPLADEQ